MAPGPAGAVKLAQMFHDEETLDAVKRVLESGRFIRGPEGAAFEAEFARFVGAKHAVVCASGTAAIEVLFMALGIRPGDEVIVPSMSFVATATPVMHLGATPVFADVSPDTLTLDPEDVRAKITARTKAIMPVHLFGHPADMAPLREIADAHGLKLIEDACQAHGAAYRGRNVGTLGHGAVFSFFPSKNMTVAGDGGAFVTDDASLADRVRSLTDAGRTPGNVYAHSELGLNFRLNEMQSAIGRVQLKHLPRWNEQRRANAESHRKAISAFEAYELPEEKPWARHVYHQFVIQTDRRDELRAFLASRGIESAVHYPIPIHQQAFVATGETLPITERACRRVLSLPVHPFLTEGQRATLYRAIGDFVHA